MTELMSAAEWYKYRNMLKKINMAAVEEFQKILNREANYQGFLLTLPRSRIIEVADALVMKYGTASAEAACQLHDAVAEVAGVRVPAAEPAELPTIHEIAKVVNGAAKKGSDDIVSQAVGRMVKQVGQDTTLKNAARDGAEWAWVPAGETCAYCIALASEGWQTASKAAQMGAHADHIHPNCDCAYCIRFSKYGGVGGYDPGKYKRMYYNGGNTAKERLNNLRRDLENDGL